MAHTGMAAWRLFRSLCEAHSETWYMTPSRLQELGLALEFRASASSVGFSSRVFRV